jgi:hypothetical protein
MVEAPTYPAPPTVAGVVGHAVDAHVSDRPAARNGRRADEYPAPPTMRSAVAALVDEYLGN